MNLTNKKIFTFNFLGKDIIFEIDKFAKRSEKSVLCRYGKTVVLTTLCSSKIDKDDDFAHLSIVIDEKFYSISKIPSGFNKREGRATYESILASRMVDRSLRPFLSDSKSLEIQIVNTVMSVSEDFDPRLAICWSSFLVLLLSGNVSQNKVSSTVSVAEVDGVLVCNPNFEQIKKSSFEMFITFSEDKIFMIEAFCNETNNFKLEEAISFASSKSKEYLNFLSEVFSSFNLVDKFEKPNLELDKKPEVILFKNKIKECLNQDLEWEFKKLKISSLLKNFNKEFEEPKLFSKVFNSELKNKLRSCLSDYGKRLDERKVDQIREIDITINFLPDSHGSCIFSRGKTEVLSIVTLGKVNEKKNLEDSVLYLIPKKNFLHHYNFPSFSVGEISNLKSVSRREVGHGNLVERSFSNFVPSTDLFPYMTRIVSEVLSAEGSSSQASICSSSLALMASGFPLYKHVAGVSLGIFEGNVFVDIDEIEDRIGETDFKISGTETGICSLQMDTKNQGLEINRISEFLSKGESARLFIIQKMKKVIDKPSESISSSVPKFRKIYIGKSKIGFVIGQKGKVIESIIAKTGVKVDFQNDSYAVIYHQDEQKIEEACFFINDIINKSSSF